MKKLIRGLTLHPLLLSLSISTAVAAERLLPPPGAISPIPKPSTVRIENLGDLIGAGLGAIIVFALLLVLVFLIWGGFQWLTSGGDKAATEAARSRITAALLGMVIVAAAWALIKIIEIFFGVNLISEGTIPIPKPYKLPGE